MQAYFDENTLTSTLREEFLDIFFYGNNFNSEFQNKEYNEFKIEKLQDIELLKKNILETEPFGIIIRGGEPLLQRQALILLFKFCKQNKIRTAIETNLTKPKVIDSLIKLNLIDEIYAKIMTNEKDFKKITNCGTFFTNSEEFYKDTIKTLKILNKKCEEVKIKFITEVISGYVFRKETFLEIAKKIANIKSIWFLKKFDPNIHDEKFKSIDPPSDKFIENLQEIIKNKYPETIIEII